MTAAGPSLEIIGHDRCCAITIREWTIWREQERTILGEW
jgi:hypothetical protein